MSTGITLSMFTGLVSGADVTALIGQSAIVWGGLIAILLAVAVIFIFKSGMGKAFGMIASAFGVSGGR